MYHTHSNYSTHSTYVQQERTHAWKGVVSPYITLLGKVNLNPIFVRTATPVVSAKYRTNTSITSNLETNDYLPLT